LEANRKNNQFLSHNLLLPWLEIGDLLKDLRQVRSVLQWRQTSNTAGKLFQNLSICYRPMATVDKNSGIVEIFPGLENSTSMIVRRVSTFASLTIRGHGQAGG